MNTSIDMISLIAVSFLIFVTYLVCMSIKNRNIPESVSQTYYISGRTSLFFVWMASIAFLLFPAWVDLGGAQPLTFLSVVFLTGVGAFPEYLSEHKTPHFICAGLAAVLSMIWMCLYATPLLLIPPVLFGCAMSAIFRKQWLFWCECALFLSIYVFLGYLYLK